VVYRPALSSHRHINVIGNHLAPFLSAASAPARSVPDCQRIDGTEKMQCSGYRARARNRKVLAPSLPRKSKQIDSVDETTSPGVTLGAHRLRDPRSTKIKILAGCQGGTITELACTLGRASAILHSGRTAQCQSHKSPQLAHVGKQKATKRVAGALLVQKVPARCKVIASVRGILARLARTFCLREAGGWPKNTPYLVERYGCIGCPVEIAFMSSGQMADGRCWFNSEQRHAQRRR
jgi:hypothetical protein